MLSFSIIYYPIFFLNDVKFLKILDGTYSVKEDVITENDLIEVFKFLSLDKKDFENFIQ